jgi:hypothetical protein
MRANANNLLLIGAVAVGGYMLGPQIRDYGLPFIGNLRSVNMHLDPNVEPGRIEDRRRQHGDGGDLGRLGPPPQWGGQREGVPSPPWDEARGDAERPDTPGGVGCWDSVEHHPVDMSFCDHGRTGNAEGFPRDGQGHPSRRWRYCTNSPGHVRRCGPWQTGSAREGE